MAKNSIRDYSATSSLNTDVQSVDISEGCAASGINNAIREVMADLKDVSSGTIALESPQADSLTVTGDLTVDTNTLHVDAANNRVGVGTTSPGAALTVEGTKDSLASQLKITATGVVSQYIGGGDNVGLAIGHDHSSLPIIFKTGVAGGTGVTGSGTERVRILGGGGLTFNGDTAQANALDDYEEGTWTPTLRFGGSTAGISYSSQLGRYTKIGDTVHVQVFIALSSKGSASGAADISGLPFGQKSGGFHCFGINAFNWASGTNYPAGQVNQNESVVQIKQLGTDTSFTNGAFSNTTGLRMSFMYITG